MEDQSKRLSVRLEHGFCSRYGGFIVRLLHLRGTPDEEEDALVSEEFLHPTSVQREPLPDEVPGKYRSDFDEATDVSPLSRKASAAISRRLLQHTLRERFGIKPSALAAEIDDLLEQPGIPSHLTEAVDAVRNIGNFAAHPLKDQSTGSIVEVEPGEAEWLLETLNALFDFTFVQPARLAEKRKQLNDKLRSMGKPALK